MIAAIARRTSLGVLAFWAVAASQPTQAQPEWVTALRGGGYVIIMRHGATHQDQADTDPLNLANVDKQRQLNDAGRDKAREIGEAYKKLGIPVGQVVTSQYYRAIETGKLAFGSGQPTAEVSEVVFKPDGAGAYRPWCASRPTSGRSWRDSACAGHNLSARRSDA
jgi:hypothetical protein